MIDFFQGDSVFNLCQLQELMETLLSWKYMHFGFEFMVFKKYLGSKSTAILDPLGPKQINKFEKFSFDLNEINLTEPKKVK